MSSRDPWRAVLLDPPPIVYEGRGSVLGPDTARRTRWYEMRLECGHMAERTVRYRKRAPDEPAWKRARSHTDVLPPPRRVRCEQCGGDARHRTT